MADSRQARGLSFLAIGACATADRACAKVYLSVRECVIMNSVFRLAARRTKLGAKPPGLEAAPVSEKRYSLSRAAATCFVVPLFD
jgi:hypothetical protein